MFVLIYLCNQVLQFYYERPAVHVMRADVVAPGNARRRKTNSGRHGYICRKGQYIKDAVTTVTLSLSPRPLSVL
jgi:hypothetical protein